MSEAGKNRKRKKKKVDYGDGFHTSKVCQSCPYGFKTYCIGVCWKELYKGYPRKTVKTDQAGKAEQTGV